MDNVKGGVGGGRADNLPTDWFKTLSTHQQFHWYIPWKNLYLMLTDDIPKVIKDHLKLKAKTWRGSFEVGS